MALKTATPNSVVWSFIVADTSSAATLATITNFEVTNGEAARFSLNTPSSFAAGVPFSLKVTVLDAYGNTVKNYFGTIHFSDTAGPAGLPADYTFTAADSGVHPFTITLPTAADQSITIVAVGDPTLTASSLLKFKARGGGGGGGGSSGSGK